MDLHALQAFVEVADRSSFSAAAEALFLTQPTVSMQIKKLTDAMGLPLFETGRLLADEGVPVPVLRRTT
mgnify:CR=1 FL=1